MSGETGRTLDPERWTAEEVAARFGLAPLEQEGGWFRRTGESERWVSAPGGGEARRAWSTIYALFTPEGFSALHRLATDEVWCFHAGDVLEQLRLREDGSGEWIRIGAGEVDGQRLQTVVSAGVWQGTRLAAGGRWALVTCVVAPEFVWADFVLAERAEARAKWPEFAEAIATLTRGRPAAGMR